MSSTATVDDRLARLLAEKARESANGIVTATSGKLKRVFCLQRGVIAYSASNVIEEQFDEVLVRKELLSAKQRAEAKLRATNENKKLSMYLKEQQVVKPSVLTEALEEHVATLVRSSLQNAGAEYVFDDGQPDLSGELTVQVSCVPLVLEFAQNHPAPLNQLRVRIGPPNMRPARTEAAATMLEGVKLSDLARGLVESSDGSRSLSALVADAKASPEEALRTLYGLLLLGIVVPAKQGEVVRRDRQDALTRGECEARLNRSEDVNHYELLGVDPQASADQIREAYYYLARRYHPDRFRTGSLTDLFDKMEAFFTQVTGAYNTLFEPELRSRYDEELAARAAGTKKDEPEVDTKYLAKQNYARAKLLIDRKRFQDAVQFLENAIELDDSQATYHRELGELLVLNPRRRADAEKHLRRAIELNPASAPTYFALGQLYRRMGKTDKAIKLFREVLSWDPGHADAKAQLAELVGADDKGLFGGLFKS